jgi:hypothetical protein
VDNVQSWIKDKGCIARKETEYVEQAKDVMSLEKAVDDSALSNVAAAIERLLAHLPRVLSSV